MNGTSLFDLKVPGVMTAEEIEETYPLDQQSISARGRLYEAEVGELHILFTIVTHHFRISWLGKEGISETRDLLKASLLSLLRVWAQM